MIKYVFDIDGTVCNSIEGDYENSFPIYSRIIQINKLHDEGNEIIFYTARGMGSSKNDISVAKTKWEELTKQQLSAWGVKYHSLYMGKPAGDFYIDDKGLKDTDFFTK